MTVLPVVTINFFGRPYRIHNPGPGRVGSKLRYGEPYEKKLLVDMYHRRFTGSAFDVGAHIGNHSLWMAAVCGLKVYAWEPHDGSRAMLMDNLTLNPGLDVEVFSWAAGDRHTTGRFTTGMWLSFDPARDGEQITLEHGDVDVQRIDDGVTVDDLSVVKIDVEGMEPAVLTGLERHLEACRPVVYAETHTIAMHNEIGAVLAPFGYEMTRRIEMGSPTETWEPR